LLDASAPTVGQLREAVAWLRELESLGPVYVHCAAGHGRSVCIVVAYLLAIGAADSIEAAERRLRELRSGVRLNADQIRSLRQFQAELA
jgi:protein-tyrosine phosphatase